MLEIDGGEHILMLKNALNYVLKIFCYSPKPSLKIRTANTIFWISLGIFRDYGLKKIF